jgi:hypothetical protein
VGWEEDSLEDVLASFNIVYIKLRNKKWYSGVANKNQPIKESTWFRPKDNEFKGGKL